MSDELHDEPRMSDSDALRWTIEKDPLLRSTITAIVPLFAGGAQRRVPGLPR